MSVLSASKWVVHKGQLVEVQQTDESVDDKAITRFKLSGTTALLDGANKRGGLDDSVALGGDEATSLRAAEEEEFGRTRADEVEKQARDEALARINMLDLETRRDIAHMDIIGEYGSKVGNMCFKFYPSLFCWSLQIDFLVKHLLYYRARQPDVRHVIFSNWSDSLGSAYSAFNRS
jgi:E3 ubiquitin-protein ligase SHPRH